ncbi:MAG: histidine--tRNA ligase [Pseudomonadales bacterium]
MQDLLPDQKEIYRYIEDVLRRVLSAYGYREIGLPVIESTQLFSRLVGEATDIVEKEMYTFDDRNGDSITLRPEGTAGCVRAAQENGLLFNQVQRLWYAGPMFRYERPQKGRYRQFEQIGAECFGMPGPDVDVELLLMTHRMWKTLGIAEHLTLELNSMGSLSARQRYTRSLVEYLEARKEDLDKDSQRRITSNPLRILDSKDEGTRDVLKEAPLITDYLDDESRQQFDQICGLLDQAQLAYRINPFIVRGLDYYNKTVFEWTTQSLGAQGTVCAGGRYDGLVEEVGGKPTPAVGFALGMDRLALMLGEKFEFQASADVYIASLGDGARRHALLLAEELRDSCPARTVIAHCGEGKFKSQMKKADQSGALMAIIIGEDEVERGEVSIKHLREGGDQISMDAVKVKEYVRKMLTKE